MTSEPPGKEDDLTGRNSESAISRKKLGKMGGGGRRGAKENKHSIIKLFFFSPRE